MPNGMRAPDWRPRTHHQHPFEGICCWPGCNATQGWLKIPLCDHHAARTWRRVQAQLDEATAQGKSKMGTIYCIRFGDRVKIGWTQQVRQRMQALPHDEVLGTMPGTMAEEAALHRAFDHLRLTGEWFRDDPQIRHLVAGWARQ